ncbi:MAG: membrane protein insertion efficiency factor YidD [Ruminococcus sp.]|jgi:putative membrane protein insertion efficiency factor|nr:membrane protein insertion efficiency factor YidD [Ruminococcus sp.]
MKRFLLFCIRFYSKHISPFFGRRCKYYPTCSSYAFTAIKKHGTIKGTILAVWRLLRCNPWSMGGIDYVPDRFGLYFVKNMGLSN